MQKLKIYSDPNFSSTDVPIVPVMRPFFQPDGVSNPSYGWSIDAGYADYWQRCRDFFEVTSLEDADIAILPVDWTWIRGFNWSSSVNKALEHACVNFCRQVQQQNKPVVIFNISDRSHESLPIKDAFTFRTGPYKTRKTPKDFAMPAFHEDLLKTHYNGQIPLRQKSEVPVVGFRGLAKKHNSLSDHLKLGLYYPFTFLREGYFDASPYKGENLRVQLVEQLKEKPAIQTNFHLQTQATIFGSSDTPEVKMQNRMAYVSNLAESDYILCCRGSGNFSVRFYETLCMGRIPIFINTDCELPLASKIDWRRYCVWVEEAEIPHLSEKILAFHRSLSAAEFVDLQYECRQLWEQFLCPTGFFAHFYEHFQQPVSLAA